MTGSAGQAASGVKKKIGFLVVACLVSILNISISGRGAREKGPDARKQALNLEDEELFKKYGWTITSQVHSFDLVLPSTFIHEAGEFPIKLYWAYNHELSRSIGLDFAPYLGEKMRATIYALSEPWPDAMRPDNKARGVTLRAGPKLVGAYIHSWRHYKLNCSLDRKQLAEVVKKSWGEWLDGYVDYDNEIEKRLSAMRPEEIISEYFRALDRHDWTFSRACLTRRYLMDRLPIHTDDRYLYHEDYAKGGFKSAKLISVQELPYLAKGNPPGTIEYEVICDCIFENPTTLDDGINYIYMIMERETARGGWKIGSIGTGP